MKVFVIQLSHCKVSLLFSFLQSSHIFAIVQILRKLPPPKNTPSIYPYAKRNGITKIIPKFNFTNFFPSENNHIYSILLYKQKCISAILKNFFSNPNVLPLEFKLYSLKFKDSFLKFELSCMNFKANRFEIKRNKFGILGTIFEFQRVLKVWISRVKKELIDTVSKSKV